VERLRFREERPPLLGSVGRGRGALGQEGPGAVVGKTGARATRIESTASKPAPHRRVSLAVISDRTSKIGI
jgi:hypothetical protein